MAAWDPSCFSSIDSSVPTFKCLEALFSNLVISIMTLSGVALFLLLIIGGYNFLFAGGDPKKMEKAKGTLTGALTGIIIVAVAFLLLQLIAQITGVKEILNFSIIFKDD
jgi:amino acid transporter